jgi:hypothetical protein
MKLFDPEKDSARSQLESETRAMTTFHIRAPMPRKGGNSFYKDNSPRIAKTLCGQPVTSHDIRFSWGAASAEPVGNFVCCEQCLAIKKQTKASP